MAVGFGERADLGGRRCNQLIQLGHAGIWIGRIRPEKSTS